jgi:hypothetical protein
MNNFMDTCICLPILRDVSHINAKVPEVPLAKEEVDIQVVTDKPKPAFEALAATALEKCWD